ncbi:hypothetical protein OAF54_03375 [bacterium]|nr:hypothetical protein [bacterium]
MAETTQAPKPQEAPAQQPQEKPQKPRVGWIELKPGETPTEDKIWPVWYNGAQIYARYRTAMRRWKSLQGQTLDTKLVTHYYLVPTLPEKKG